MAGSHHPRRRPRALVGAIALLITLAFAPTADAATPGGQLWVSLYSGGATNSAHAKAIATSPDGSTVFVTGERAHLRGSDFGTVAYSVATGTREWAARYDGPAHETDSATSIAVKPDGSTVFVTGSSQDAGGVDDLATVAYSASSGAVMWAARYAGPRGGSGSDPVAITTKYDGSAVFVTGTSGSRGGTLDYATVAFDASNGSRLWVSRYDGPGHSNDEVAALGVSPHGASVVVTGASPGIHLKHDYATVAYDASTGAVRWVSRYNEARPRFEAARAIGISPHGSTVFVTGDSGLAAATIAYDAGTGQTIWVRRFRGTVGAQGTSLQVSSTGQQVFVAGQELLQTTCDENQTDCTDPFTSAYDAATGDRQWIRRFIDDRTDFDPSLVTTPDGTKVILSSTSYANVPSHYVTAAYSSSTGAKLWSDAYPSDQQAMAIASAVAAGSDGSTVFVTGTSTRTGTSIGTGTTVYATVAYAL